MKYLLEQLRHIAIWIAVAYFVYILFIQNVGFPENFINFMVISILLLVIQAAYKQINELKMENEQKEEIIQSLTSKRGSPKT